MKGTLSEECLVKLEELSYNARKLLAFTPLQYMLDAVMENPSMAKIYINNKSQPSICIILLGHYLFVGGNLTDGIYEEIYNTVLTKDVRASLGILIIFCEAKEGFDHFKKYFTKTYDNERSLYYIKPLKSEMPSFTKQINRINNELIQSNIENVEMIIEEIESTGTYSDIRDFCRRGIGYTPIIQDRVCGFCTSEYPSKQSIAIGIEVTEEYQKQGIAKALTKSFLFEAAVQSMTVYWECWKLNISSVNTALSCGFKKIIDYPVLFVGLNSYKNY